MYSQHRIRFFLPLCLFIALLLSGLSAHADVDVNHDGLPDLLFQNQSTGQIVYWGLNDAVFVGGASIQPPASADWQLRDSTDLNGDGKADLIFQNSRTGQVVVWYMNGPNIIASGALPLIPAPGYQVVGTGDFNSDGHADLVLQSVDTGQIAIWFLNGLNVIGGAVPVGALPPLDPNNQVVGVADFNGDGYPDFVFQNRSTRAISFVAMRGMQGVGGVTMPLLSNPGDNVVGLGDFNGDGNPDLLFQNSVTGQLTYWLLNHTSGIGFGNLPTPGSLDWKVAGVRTFAPLHPQVYWINGVSLSATGNSETLTTSFTQANGGITLADYQGYVRVHVTGVVQSSASLHNDAFYLYNGQSGSTSQTGSSGGYSQLAFSTTTLPVGDIGQDIAQYLVGPVPGYNSAHDYTVLVNTGLSTPGRLHFGVSTASLGGNTGAYTITVTQLAPPPLVLHKIVFLGDSITEDGTYPTVVATAFGATAINAGIYGQEISAMLARVDTDVIAQHPDLCVLFAGTNDAYFATPIAQFQADYDAVLKKLKAANIPVVVVTPPHFAAAGTLNSTYLGRDLNTSLAPVVAAIRAEATLNGLTVAEVYNADIPLNSDGEHPNADGQATIAQIVTAAIQSALSTGRY